MRMKVSTAEFLENFSRLADRARSEPVTITENGRDRLVVISAEEYARLERRDRRVVKLEEFTPEEIALIAEADASPGAIHADNRAFQKVLDWIDAPATIEEDAGMKRLASSEAPWSRQQR